MNREENPVLSPHQYYAALKRQLTAYRKIRKIYKKEVLSGSLLYHTSLRNVNNQIAEVYDEIIVLVASNPEVKKTFKEKAIEKLIKVNAKLEEFGAAAAGATQKH